MSAERKAFDAIIDNVRVHYKIRAKSSAGTSKYHIVACKDFDESDPLPERKWKGFGVANDSLETIEAHLRKNLDRLPSGAIPAFLWTR